MVLDGLDDLREEWMIIFHKMGERRKKHVIEGAVGIRKVCDRY
jgi:hypothetical protein